MYSGFGFGYDCVNPNIESRYLDNVDSNSPNFIILRHILEPIENPYSFLKRLKLHYQANSRIYIEVPDLEWKESNLILQYSIYQHVNQFS